MTQSCAAFISDVADDLTDLKKRLDDADKKKKALQNDLQAAEDQLDGIKRGRTRKDITGLA